jgi:hypothetical protein
LLAIWPEQVANDGDNADISGALAEYILAAYE